MSKELLYKKLLDIKDAIERIENSFSKIKNAESFLENSDSLDKMDAISMRLQAIGEVVKKIQKEFPELLELKKEVDWKGVINFRDKISHHYFDIDSEEIFKICKHHLPILSSAVNELIDQIEK